jgi:hypothetical protein
MDMAARIDFNGLMTPGFPARDAGRCERRDAAQQAAAPERVVMELEPYRVASLHTRGPVTITCLSGQLWITTPGELDDVILQAGQRRVMQAPARDVLLSTVGARCPATFSIGAAAARGKAAAPFRVEFA